MKKFGKKSKFYEVKNFKYVILNRLFIFFCKKSYKDFVFNIKRKSKIRETQVKILLEIPLISSSSLQFITNISYCYNAIKPKLLS